MFSNLICFKTYEIKLLCFVNKVVYFLVCNIEKQGLIKPYSGWGLRRGHIGLVLNLLSSFLLKDISYTSEISPIIIDIFCACYFGWLRHHFLLTLWYIFIYRDQFPKEWILFKMRNEKRFYSSVFEFRKLVNSFVSYKDYI